MGFCFGVFSPFSIAITSLVGKRERERAVLCAFHAFAGFTHDGLGLFPLTLCVRDWLRLVTVAIPGLFFLPFCF